MAFLSVKNLRKNFGSTSVLQGIDFEVEKGEVVSVIGSSGNGKTTLLRCLNFLELADGGSVAVDGQEIYDAGKKYSDEQLRKARLHFGMVFQSFNLFPQYTALQNVRLALDVQSKERIKREWKEREKNVFRRIIACRAAQKEAVLKNEEDARRILADVGLADKTDNYPCELSGGQCQRVAIARALALKPEILCFDEPTSALDPELTGEVLRVIRGLKSPDRSMIIVTHEMSFAREVSDKIIFLSEGRIEEMGTPEQIFLYPQSEKTKAFLKNYAAQNGNGQ